LSDAAAADAFTRIRARLQSVPASETTPAAHHVSGEAPVRGGNGHAAIYRIELLEKTGRFERR